MLGVGSERLDELVSTAERLDPHARAAVILGLLETASVVDADQRRRLVRIGLATGMARVRRAALEDAWHLRPAARRSAPSP